mgnify:FL=1
MQYKLGNIAIFIRNGVNIKNDKSKGGIPITRIETISDGIVNENKMGYADIIDDRYKDYYLKQNDILMSHINSAKHLGKVAIFNGDKKIIHGMNLLDIRLNNDICNSKYVYYFFKTKRFKKQLNKISKQSVNQSSFTVNDLKEIKISLPLLEKQKMIANKLDKVQAMIDLRKKQTEELDKLIKSQFVEIFGDPIENPKNNKIVKLSDIAEYWNGLTYKPTDVNKEGTIVLRSSNIQNSRLDYEDVVRVDCDIKEKLYVKDNDILMCSRNGSSRLVGKVAVIKDTLERMTFGAFMMIIRSEYYPYLFSYFQTDAFRNQIKSGATTTINQITGNMLNKIKLPLPDMKDIEKFTEFVKQVDKQKFLIEKSLKETKDLQESLMNKYFL